MIIIVFNVDSISVVGDGVVVDLDIVVGTFEVIVGLVVVRILVLLPVNDEPTLVGKDVVGDDVIVGRLVVGVIVVAVFVALNEVGILVELADVDVVGLLVGGVVVGFTVVLVAVCVELDVADVVVVGTGDIFTVGGSVVGGVVVGREDGGGVVVVVPEVDGNAVVGSAEVGL